MNDHQHFQTSQASKKFIIKSHHNHRKSSNSPLKKNQIMNRSAVLTDKFASPDEIPNYITTKSKLLRQLKGQNCKNQENLSPFSNIAGASLASSNLRINKGSDKNLRIRNSENQEYRPWKLPKEIVDIMYRQGIKNYNPLLETMNQLQKYGQSEISYIDRENVKKLCYLGIAKKYFCNKKYAHVPSYSRTGVLIRTYMNQIMSEKIEKKRNQEQIIIIESNPTALNFNPYTRPKELQEHVGKKKYAQIIKCVNSIIGIEYKKYKLSNCSFMKNSPTYCELTMYILVTILIFILIIWAPTVGSDAQIGGLAAVIGLIFCGIIGSWIECNRNFSKVQQSNNMIDTALKKLERYFESISNDSMTWKIGQDFYWIEIHNMKIQKRKFYVNSEDY